VNEFNSIQESARHTPQVCDQRLAKLFLSQDTDVVVGARKLMAIQYGSCEVLKQPVRGKFSNRVIPETAASLDVEKKEFSVNKEEVLRNHPYLQVRQESSCGDLQVCKTKSPEEMNACDAAACMVLEHPPLYQYGSRLLGHSTFAGVQKGETSALGMDDAAFISEAFSMMGVRVRPDKTIDQAKTLEGGFTNNDFWNLGAIDSKGKPLDCFDRISGKPGILPGDLITLAGNHTVMIDTVGADPFGIEALRKRANNELQLNLKAIMAEKGLERTHMISTYNQTQLMNTHLDDVLNGRTKLDYNLQKDYLEEIAKDACTHLLRKPEDYRVTIIHSSPRGGLIGIQREKVFPGLGSHETLSPLGSAFQMKVIADCMQTLWADWLKEVPASNEKIRVVLEGEPRFVTALKKREYTGRGAHLIRLNPSYEGCKSGLGERPLFEASQCVRCCPTDATYDQLVPDEPKEVQKW
jgi:hypothetical protein